MNLKKFQSWFGPLLVILLLLLAILLWLSPVEQTLGQTVKLVYLHGALVRTAVILFAVALPVNLVAAINGRDSWLAWGKALAWTAIGIWLLHTLFSMITTYAAWGVFIAWGEPRTRFTFNLAAVGLLALAVTGLVDHARFSAGVFGVVAGIVLALMPGLGFIQHPLDPIGSSPSGAIRLFYAAILLVSLALGVLGVVWLRYRIRPKILPV